MRRCERHRFVVLPKRWDRGAHLGLDQPLSSAGTRLRASRSQGGRVRPSRNDPSHAPAPRLNVLIRNRNFPEGLSEAHGLVLSGGSGSQVITRRTIQPSLSSHILRRLA